MTCTNPACPNPKKEHLFLYAGKLCENCRTQKSAPFNKAAYDRQYYKDNPRQEYHRDRMRRNLGVEVGKFVVECDGLYKINRCMVNRVHLTWGNKNQAKIYQSRKLAEYAVRMIGKGMVEKIK